MTRSSLKAWFHWSDVPGLTLLERLALFFPTKHNLLWYLRRLDARFAATDDRLDSLMGEIGVAQAQRFLQRELDN